MYVASSPTKNATALAMCRARSNACLRDARLGLAFLATACDPWLRGAGLRLPTTAASTSGLLDGPLWRPLRWYGVAFHHAAGRQRGDRGSCVVA
jgi:hypothetical protein